MGRVQGTVQTEGRAGGRIRALLLVAVVGVLLSACGGNHPRGEVADPPGVEVLRDLAYGSDPDQRLDVHRSADAQHAPILVMVHGGGWRRGDKANPGVVKNKVAHYVPAGYLVVSINYRLSPEVDPLAQAHDVAAALSFVQSAASAWGGDPSRIVLMGHSAGAHLVSLVTADPGYREGAGAASWLGTIALDSAAYDVPQIMNGPHPALYDDAFGQDEVLQREASPTLVLSGTPEPVLLVCGSNRAEACPQADAFGAAVRAHGSTATVLPIDMSHGDIDSQVGVAGPLTSAVDDFLTSLGLPT